jgi:hypothetical protein
MADTLERIYKLTVDGGEAVRQLQRVANSTQGVEEKMAKAGKAIRNFAGGIGLAFTAREIISGIQGVIDAMDEAVKASQRLGISVESLQEWQFALRLSGVDAGTFATAVGKVAQGIQDIDAGEINKTTQALRAFGVTAKDTSDQALEKLIDGFSRMSDGPLKTALALDVFGKAGKELIPLMNSGAAGIAAMRRELGLLQGTFTAEDAKRAEEFNDNMEKIKTAAAGTGRAIASTILPELVNLTGALVENIKQLGFWAGTVQTIMQSASGELGSAEERLQVLLKRRDEVQTKTLGGFNVLAQLNLNSINAQIEVLREQARVEREQAADKAKFARQAARFADEAIAKAKAQADAEAAAAARKKLVDDLITKSHESIGEARAKEARQFIEAQERMQDAIRKTAEAAVSASELQRTNLSVTAGLNQADKERLEVQMDLAKQADEFDKKRKQEILTREELARMAVLGTDKERAFANAQLEAMKATEENTKALEKQRTEMDVLTEGAQAFFDNLGRGAADASELFKRAIQSIIANLLQLWAKKYIIEALSGMFGGGSSQPFMGGGGIAAPFAAAAPPASVATPQTRTGVGAMPMAAGVAPPMPLPVSGLVPLPTPSVQQGASNQMQVHVHNNNGSQVSVETSEDGARIDVIIDRTRRALAQDVRTGGSLFSGALESTYALGRARA